MTGAAGQIAYSLLYSIAKGDVFGKEQVSYQCASNLFFKWGKWSPALLCKLSVVGHAEVFQFSVNGF